MRSRTSPPASTPMGEMATWANWYPTGCLPRSCRALSADSASTTTVNQRISRRDPGGNVAASRRGQERRAKINEDAGRSPSSRTQLTRQGARFTPRQTQIVCRGPQFTRPAPRIPPTWSQARDEGRQPHRQQDRDGKASHQRQESVQYYHRRLSPGGCEPTSPRSMRSRKARASFRSPGWLSPCIEHKSRNSSHSAFRSSC